MIAAMGRSAFRQIGADRADEWLAKGHRLRHFFAHRLFQLPKCGPDGYRLGERMCGELELGRHWQLLMYADRALVEDFPSSLFFDDDVVWHQQHFGRRGQVASASILVRPDGMYTFVHQSDLVQRIGLAREHKTRIENRFRGWPWMLMNGLLAFALERGIRTLRTPSSQLAMRHTDPTRSVQPYLFERVYDRPPAEFPGAVLRGDWWEIDVDAARAAVVDLVAGSESVPQEKTVCVMHDLERGFGHRSEDPELARRADETAQQTLQSMIAVESEAGLRATYNVVGQILPEVRADIESAGHALAFHSFDHGGGKVQLHRCRELDYRLKGYRLPRSRRDPELTDEQLAFHNFEWLGSSQPPLAAPELQNRLVRIPVTLDDFSLYTRAKTYEEWETELMAHVDHAPFTTIGLHDCYADRWLPRYGELIRRLSARARLRTLDEASADAVMSAAA